MHIRACMLCLLVYGCTRAYVQARTHVWCNDHALLGAWRQGICERACFPLYTYLECAYHQDVRMFTVCFWEREVFNNTLYACMCSDSRVNEYVPNLMSIYIGITLVTLPASTTSPYIWRQLRGSLYLAGDPHLLGRPLVCVSLRPLPAVPQRCLLVWSAGCE